MSWQARRINEKAYGNTATKHRETRPSSRRPMTRIQAIPSNASTAGESLFQAGNVKKA
ncbi:hypothetical protein IG631_04733 [Alternaria alternata]|nr:hypothetical protein IG631_04733 [Alternaria alternata]